MEDKVKLGSVGEADVSATKDSEKASASLVVGPLKISVVAELDNRSALDYLASKVPGGWEHDAIVALKNLLLPAETPSA